MKEEFINKRSYLDVPDSSETNLINDYKEAVEFFSNNSVDINGKQYIEFSKAVEVLRDVAPFSSMFK